MKKPLKLRKKSQKKNMKIDIERFNRQGRKNLQGLTITPSDFLIRKGVISRLNSLLRLANAENFY